MRALFAALFLFVAACNRPHEAYAYPQAAVREFAEKCPTRNASCGCIWDKITHTVPPDEYAADLARFKKDGLMDPRLTEARLECRDKH